MTAIVRVKFDEQERKDSMLGDLDTLNSACMGGHEKCSEAGIYEVWNTTVLRHSNGLPCTTNVIFLHDGILDQIFNDAVLNHYLGLAMNIFSRKSTKKIFALGIVSVHFHQLLNRRKLSRMLHHHLPLPKSTIKLHRDRMDIPSMTSDRDLGQALRG